MIGSFLFRSSHFGMPSMLRLKALLLAFGVGLLLSACSGDPGTGPAEVHWDRDSCDRCRMVLSDHYHAAQVRHTDAEGRSQVWRFDDLGCAVIWLEGQSWRDDPAVEIWVTDRNSGEWIDARKATYVEGDHTPMAYGLGALMRDGKIDFAAARAHIHEVEARYNTPVTTGH